MVGSELCLDWVWVSISIGLGWVRVTKADPKSSRPNPIQLRVTPIQTQPIAAEPGSRATQTKSNSNPTRTQLEPKPNLTQIQPKLNPNSNATQTQSEPKPNPTQGYSRALRVLIQGSFRASRAMKQGSFIRFEFGG